MMRINMHRTHAEPYTLQLKHTFTIASTSRTTTPVMLTRIDYDGLTGYGEAAMPNYPPL